MRFFRNFLAAILGCIVGFIILFFLGFGIISALVSSAGKTKVEVKPNTVLYMKLNTPIEDRAPENPMQNFDFASFSPIDILGLNQIIENLEKAQEDENIKGVFLELSTIPAGMATVEEIRNALIDFKSSGKFVIVYSEALTQKAYYLGSVADSIYMQPEGAFLYKGIASQGVFFANALDKLGIEPQIIRHGKFKSAVEPFIRQDMSDENFEQTKAYVGSMWDHMLIGISTERNLPAEKLQLYADSLMVVNPAKAVELGLIDGLMYKDEIIAAMKKRVGIDKEKDIKTIKISKYTKVPKKREGKGLAKDKIAVVYATGNIQMGKGDTDYIGSEGLSKAIRKARKDENIKAIVLRINSPGGNALASDIIWREVKLAADTKTVVVSMGNLAASGGYYIACAADTILANPTTITGSIGVFGVLINANELMNEKLGISIDGYKTNPYADIGSPFRPLTDFERSIIKQQIEDVYSTFVEHVSEGRDMAEADVDSIGQGRVWSGINAKEINLIDDFGGLKDAIELAAQMEELDRYRIVNLPEQKDPFEELMTKLSEQTQTYYLKKRFGTDFKYYQQLNDAIRMQGIQARLPYHIYIN